MSNEKFSYIELFKYPVIVFSILIALIVSKYTLGIKFGSISKIGAEGVEFNQMQKGEFADLSSRLNSALTEIEELKNKVGLSDEDFNKVQDMVFKAAQTVSDQTAQIATLSSGDVNFSSITGYIWVGNYDNKKKKWSHSTLSMIETGQSVSAPPDSLLPGTEYRMRGNIVVRDGLPANDKIYYKGRKSLGTITRGTKIRLVTSPIGIDREFAVQYWARIELP